MSKGFAIKGGSVINGAYTVYYCQVEDMSV